MTTAPPATDEAQLYAAILDAPADDGLRLVYADWLDEHGQGERGEFIRVQVKIAALNRELLSDEDCQDPRCPGCQERLGLQERERELWTNRDWLPMKTVPMTSGWNVFIDQTVGLSEREPANFPTAIVRRGFPDSVRLTLAAFMGGPCGRCEPIPGSQAWCNFCSGSGRTPGVAAALGRLPLRADGIVLVDRKPDEKWWWWRDDEHGTFSANRAYLPSELFDHLGSLIVRGLLYPTRAAADAALATAAVALARKRAGLTKE